MRIWAGRNNFLWVKKYVKESRVQFFRTEFMPKSSIEGGGGVTFFFLRSRLTKSRKKKKSEIFETG